MAIYNELKALLPSPLKNLLKGFIRFIKKSSPAKPSFSPNILPNSPWAFTQADLPWFDQPHALRLLEQRRRAESLSDRDYSLLRQWCLGGYCIVPSVIPEQLIDDMLREVDSLWTASEPIEGLSFSDLRLSEDEAPTPSITHADLLKIEVAQRLQARNRSNWRIHGFFLHSEVAKAVSNNPEVSRLSRLILGCDAEPRFSINFTYGSRQAAHQDTAVFQLFPPNYIVGAWIACEDIAADSGPLMYYPKSHREQLFEAFNNYPQTSLRTASSEVTNAYYGYIGNIASRYPKKLFLGRKGDVFLWHGMLLHGGSEVQKPSRTRQSYVVHFVPPDKEVSSQVLGPLNW